MTQYSHGMNFTSGSSYLLSNSFNEQREIQVVPKAENEDLLANLTKGKYICGNDEERNIINVILKRICNRADEKEKIDQNESGMKSILKTEQDSFNNPEI